MCAMDQVAVLCLSLSLSLCASNGPNPGPVTSGLTTVIADADGRSCASVGLTQMASGGSSAAAASRPLQSQ